MPAPGRTGRCSGSAAGCDASASFSPAVERLSRDESAAYFASRALGSRLAAWASDQSRPIADRAALEVRFEAARRRFPDGDVPLPPHWGGFRIVPDSYEFWTGRPDRLHDRVLFTRNATGWRQQRLMP